MSESEDRSREPQTLGEVIERMRTRFEAMEPAEVESDDGAAEAEITAAIRRYVARGIEPAIAELIARESFEETLAVTAALEWRAACVRGGTLVLIGAPDQSKTFAASLCVALGPPLPPPAHYGHPRWESRHYPRIERASRVRRTMLGRGQIAEAEQARLLELSLLAIDDLGTEYAADVDSSKAILHEFVDTRRGAGLWTLITSNLDAKSFYRFVDERMLSRLRDRGSGLVNLHKKPQPKFRGQS